MEIRPLTSSGHRWRQRKPTSACPSLPVETNSALRLVYIDALGVSFDVTSVFRNLSRLRPQRERLSARDYTDRSYRRPQWFDNCENSGLYEDRRGKPSPSGHQPFVGAVFCPPIDARSGVRMGFSARPLPRAAQAFKRRYPQSNDAVPQSRPATAASLPHPSVENSPRERLSEKSLLSRASSIVRHNSAACPRPLGVLTRHS